MATTSRWAAGRTTSSAHPSTTSAQVQVQVQVTSVGAHLLLVVSGEADLSSAPAFRDGLSTALARRPRSVTVDVSRLTYCDQAGLDALDDFCAEASGAGVPATVLGMSPLLEWMHARFPATGSAPPAVERSADAPSGAPGTLTWSPGVHPAAATSASGTPPRPWPER